MDAQSRFVSDHLEFKFQKIALDVHRDGPDWIINYKFNMAIDLNKDFKLKISGWVSNSLCKSHTIPRFYNYKLTQSQNNTLVNVISINECQEIISYQIKSDELIINIKHKDDNYLYNPLLGTRRIEIENGDYYYYEDLDLCDEGKIYIPRINTNPRPEVIDHKTEAIYFNPDYDLLHAISGEYLYWSEYRSDEIPINPGINNIYRVEFSYKIAKGSDKNFSFIIFEYQQGVSYGGWKNVSPDPPYEKKLKADGMWHIYKDAIRLQEITNTIALKFKFDYGSEFGEAWVKNIKFSPIKRIAGMSGQEIEMEVKP